MDKLLDGVAKFQKNFHKYEEIFASLKDSQNPHTLFITCSDSRIDPNLITHSKPGELFILRNIANMVAPYKQANDFYCTNSIIEYAVKVLEVENIVICGHSDCGGCKALYYDEEKLSKTPSVKKWLSLAEDVKKAVINLPLSKPQKAVLTEQLNVVEQIKNLFTYPYVREKVQNGTLKVKGWYYVIENGMIFEYDENDNEFKELN